MIVKLAEGGLQTKFGKYREILFYDGQRESIAMVLGDVGGAADVLCRVHSACVYGHYFNSIECDCRDQMEIAQRLIEREGRGIVILLEQEGKGNGHFALMQSKEHKAAGMPQAEAYEAAGFKRDARDFAAAAKILHELEIVSVCLLTGNPGKTETLTRYGVRVSGIRPPEIG